MVVPRLFSDDFPIVSSQLELDRVIACHPRYDPYYIASGCRTDRKRKFEDLWAVYHPYADRDFLPQVKLKHNFHARTWEMYLGAVLRAHSFELALASARSARGPDLQVISPTAIWIEAVTASAGDGLDKVPALVFGVSKHPEDQLLLRLRNSIAEKVTKYCGYLRDGVVQADAPYVIAVNSGGIGHPEDDSMPLMVKCAFGIGHLAIPLVREAGEKPFRLSRSSVMKRSGEAVSLGFFADETLAPVSAAIYSCRDVLNHPATIGDDCIVIHNPLALNPLPDDLFAFFGQWRLDGELLRRIPSRA